MKGLRTYTINVRGRLVDLSEPRVMGIVNVTPDSFYGDSRAQTEGEIKRRVQQIVDEGGAMVDVGAYSTRPGHAEVSIDEEVARLKLAMKAVRKVAPDIPVSVDTFRSEVARMAVEEMGADIVNDVSGGADPQMFATVAKLGVPYVLTCSIDANEKPDTPIVKSTLLFFAEKVQQLRDLGQKDIILDPGYGFGKTTEQNYELLANQDALQLLELPLLAGLSRKSMICKPLGITPQKALNGTTVLNTIALTKGASILRVHDVKEAVECVRLVRMANCPMAHSQICK